MAAHIAINVIPENVESYKQLQQSELRASIGIGKRWSKVLLALLVYCLMDKMVGKINGVWLTL